MIKKNELYWRLSDKERKIFLLDAYHEKKMSWLSISKELSTYPNKVRREAKRLGIQSRDKSSAQREALNQGRSEHPTEGRERSEETKLKISNSQGRVWDELTDQERSQRSAVARESWDKKSEEEKRNIISKGSDAIRKASKEGSKLEKFILGELTKRNYRVQFHKEHWLKNQKLETDLFIEDLRTAIEIDGPSHFEPVWGEENLRRNQRSDLEKTGLILEQGLVLIRIRQRKRISNRYLRSVLEELLKVINKIEEKFPKENKRYIEI
jgi:very-short-patch-repair endonuclease